MNQEEIQNQWKKMKAKMNSSKNLRGFLQGCQFCAKFKGFKLNLYAPSRLILKGNQLKPNFSFDVEGVNTFITCINDE